jgi:glucose/arabinose dehydrogenase
MVAFGPDGYLYIGTGDGGAANDPNNNGQDLSTLLGAILRIDVDSTTGDLPYGIPEDNPFIEREGARAEVYAYGLRNAWRFCFDPKTGLLYVGDVGQNAREEVDIVRKGGNYGWRIMEGSIRTPGVPGAETADVEDMILPIAEYRHPIGQSITGGYVYRGSNMTALQGVYLYADYVSGRLWGLRYVDGEVTAQRELPRPEMAISSFGRDEDGELYFCAHIDGVVYRLTNAAE